MMWVLNGLFLAPKALELCLVKGRDPIAALQKVVSADLRGLQPGELRRSLLLHPKGQFRALMAVGTLGKEVWLLAPAERGQELTEKLNVYLRFSRCQVESPTGAGFLLLGDQEKAAAALELPQVVPSGALLTWRGALFFGETFLGLPGVSVFGSSPPPAVPLGEEEVELARIRAGFPAWGRELVEDVLPQEVGWGEPWVSLRKGCYVGQETVARLATYGHTNRTLVRLVSEELAPAPSSLPTGLQLSQGGKEVGRLTSCVWGGKAFFGLALVRRKEVQPGTELTTGQGRWQVTEVLA